MVETKKFSLVKPTVDTPFAIDFEWWKNYDNNWRVFLQSCLCADHQMLFSQSNEIDLIDWVDPDTAEIQTVDGLQHTLISHCSKQPGFLSDHTTLVDSVFKLFVANNNSPLTPSQLAVQTGKSADTILRTLAGPQIYKGIRPCH